MSDSWWGITIGGELKQWNIQSKQKWNIQSPKNKRLTYSMLVS